MVSQRLAHRMLHDFSTCYYVQFPLDSRSCFIEAQIKENEIILLYGMHDPTVNNSRPYVKPWRFEEENYNRSILMLDGYPYEPIEFASKGYGGFRIMGFSKTESIDPKRFYLVLGLSDSEKQQLEETTMLIAGSERTGENSSHSEEFEKLLIDTFNRNAD